MQLKPITIILGEGFMIIAVIDGIDNIPHPIKQINAKVFFMIQV